MRHWSAAIPTYDLINGREGVRPFNDFTGCATIKKGQRVAVYREPARGGQTDNGVSAPALTTLNQFK